MTTLDVELKQISVEAKVLTIDKNATKNLGVKWMWSTVPQYPERDIEVDETSSGRVIITEEYRRKSNNLTATALFSSDADYLAYLLNFITARKFL